MTNFKIIAGVLGLLLSLAMVAIQQRNISQLTHRVTALEKRPLEPTKAHSADPANEIENDNLSIDRTNDQPSQVTVSEKIKSNKIQLNDYKRLSNELDLEIKKVFSNTIDKNAPEGT